MLKWLYKLLGINTSMGIRFGPFDPLQLTFNIMSALMQKGIISYDEAKLIIRNALPPEMPETEKEALINSMIIRRDPSPTTTSNSTTTTTNSEGTKNG